MVIEVTKKSLLRLGVILFVFVMFMLCGYVAYTQGYIRGYESGVADTTISMKIQKEIIAVR